MSNEIAKNMTRGPVLRQLAAFAGPVALANALQAVYSMVDMVVVGQFVGPAGLSAVGICGQLQFMFLSFGMGLGFGAQVLLSQQVGALSEKLRTVGPRQALERGYAIVMKEKKPVTGIAQAEGEMTVLFRDGSAQVRVLSRWEEDPFGCEERKEL